MKKVYSAEEMAGIERSLGCRLIKDDDKIVEIISQEVERSASAYKESSNWAFRYGVVVTALLGIIKTLLHFMDDEQKLIALCSTLYYRNAECVKLHEDNSSTISTINK